MTKSNTAVFAQVLLSFLFLRVENQVACGRNQDPAKVTGARSAPEAQRFTFISLYASLF